MYTLNVNIALTNVNYIAFLLLVNSQITSEQKKKNFKSVISKNKNEKSMKITDEFSRVSIRGNDRLRNQRFISFSKVWREGLTESIFPTVANTTLKSI